MLVLVLLVRSCSLQILDLVGATSSSIMCDGNGDSEVIKGGYVTCDSGI